MKLRENVRVTIGKTFPKCAKKHKKNYFSWTLYKTLFVQFVSPVIVRPLTPHSPKEKEKKRRKKYLIATEFIHMVLHWTHVHLSHFFNFQNSMFPKNNATRPICIWYLKRLHKSPHKSLATPHINKNFCSRVSCS